MPYAASVSTDADTRRAVQTVCDDVRSQLGGAAPDVSFLFLTQDHARQIGAIAELVVDATATRHLVGCTGETIVGGGEEIEDRPAVSLWSAVLPGVSLEPFHVEFERTPDGLISSGIPAPDESSSPASAIFLLGDPYSCAPQTVIERLADDYPGVPLLGGMASGAREPGENALFLDRKRFDHGGVGIVVRGGPRIHSLVSQGCRPIGTHLVVTKAERNIVLEIGGRPALERLKEIYADLSDADQELVQRGLHVGIAMDEYREKFDRGDFLISNVIGIDHRVGAIGIGNLIRTGQTVQFHVRDHETADEDLRLMLKRQREQHAAAPQAALLFSCNGRGTRLFPEPHHDASAIRAACGHLPLAGLFAQGELGPVGGKNYIHGFTASVALFE
jgi:small ligand-binding sensory domain FIST